MVDEMKEEFKSTATLKNSNSITKNKVDVESLKTWLIAYDLGKQGLDIFEMGLNVLWVSGAEAKDLVEDGRSRGKEYDIGELRCHPNKAVKKSFHI
jgi:hypothetical protein